MKRLSLIIVTYHSEHDIYDCLESVWKHCDIPADELEVIVVDNSEQSEPMFTRLRERYAERVTLVHNTHNGGYGQGNNVGIRMAAAPVVLIMNPDVRLCEPLFKSAVEAFEHDPRMCMYGMRQMLAEGVRSPLSFDCSRRLNGYVIPVLSSLCNKVNLYIPSIMYLQGSCFFIRKEMFEQVGLFDEDIFMYGEEDDIHWRMKRAFGPHFSYQRRQRYLHLTLERPMNLETEKKMVASTVRVNQKRGVPECRTLRNYIRYYRVRLASAKVKNLLRRNSQVQQIAILREMIQYLNTSLATSAANTQHP